MKDTVVSGAKTAATVATRVGADATAAVANAGKAVSRNEVVRDLVLDAVDYVAPRTAKRLEAQIRPGKAKKAIAKAAAKKKTVATTKKTAKKTVSSKRIAAKRKPRPR